MRENLVHIYLYVLVEACIVPCYVDCKAYPFLPFSHCLSDLPRVETLLSDHARRLGELSNSNVKSCDSSRYPRVPHPGKADERCIKSTVCYYMLDSLVFSTLLH